MATHGGSQSSLSASSDVNTVLPSTSMPGGTNGVEPVAMMMFCAVHFLFPYRTVWLSVSVAEPIKISTPSAVMELVRLPRMVVARLVAWSAIPCLSNFTSPTSMPSIFRWSASFISRTRPEAASSALEGTQPRFTHVPPMTPPSMMAVFIPHSTA